MPFSSHFVGRTAELDALDAALAALERGTPRAVEVVGPPGIGKSRLLAELGARADARGHVVLSGSGAELEQDLPYWVFVDALDEYVDGLDPRRLERLDAGSSVGARAGASRARGLGRCARAASCTSATGRTGRRGSCSSSWPSPKPLVLAARRLPLGRSGVDRPAQRAASPSAGRGRADRDRRPARASCRPRLATALDRAHRAGLLARVELPPLTREETRELVGDARRALLRGDRRQPVLPRAAGPSSRGHARRRQPAARCRLAGRAGAADGGRGADRGAVAAPAAPLAACSTAPRWRAIRSRSTSPRQPPDLAETRGAGRARRARAARARPRDRHAAPVPLPAPDRAPRRLRGHPGRLARRCARARRGGAGRSEAPRRLHAHTTSSARLATAMPAAVAVLREAGEEARSQAPATSARWLAAALRVLPDGAPPQRARRAAAADGAGAGRHRSVRRAATRRCRRSSRSSRPTQVAQRVEVSAWCARVEHLLGLHEQAHDRLIASARRAWRTRSRRRRLSLLIELAHGRLCTAWTTSR